jgi:hypothetical protein
MHFAGVYSKRHPIECANARELLGDIAKFQ